MIQFIVRLEYYRQSLRGRLLNTSISSSDKYHCMAFLVALMSWPVVPLSLAIEPGGVWLLSAETAFFFMMVTIGIFLCVTAIFSPIGLLILL